MVSGKKSWSRSDFSFLFSGRQILCICKKFCSKKMKMNGQIGSFHLQAFNFMIFVMFVCIFKITSFFHSSTPMYLQRSFSTSIRTKPFVVNFSFFFFFLCLSVSLRIYVVAVFAKFMSRLIRLFMRRKFHSVL